MDVNGDVSNKKIAATDECTSFGNADGMTEVENKSKVLIISNEEGRYFCVSVVQTNFFLDL